VSYDSDSKTHTCVIEASDVASTKNANK